MTLLLGNTQESSSDQQDTTDMFDFASIVRGVYDAVRLNQLTVIATTIFFIVVALVYHSVWPPTYKVNAVIMVERSEDSQRDSFYKEWNMFRKDDSRTEIELMKSGTVLQEVIKKESLRYDDVYHPVMSQISHFWEISIPGRVYKSIKAFLLGPSETDSLTEEEKELGKTIRDMREGFVVRTSGDILIGEIYAKGPSPRIAQITNTWIDAYLDWRKTQHLEEARRSLKTLTDQIDKVHGEILLISEKRVKFLGDNELVFDFTKETQEVEKLVNLEAEIAASHTRSVVIEASLGQIKEQLETEPEQKIVSSVVEINELRQIAEIKRLELKTSLINERYRFKPESPEIQLIEGQIADLDKLIDSNAESKQNSSTNAINPIRSDLERKKSNLEAELSGLRAGLDAMAQTQIKLTQNLTKAPALAAQLRDLDRSYAVAQQVYKVLLTKRAQADVALLSQANAMPSMRVVDYAVTPASKSWPKAKYLYPGALGIGLVFGVFAALIKSLLSAKVTHRHLESGRGGIPLFASVDVKTDGLAQPLLLTDRMRPILLAQSHNSRPRADHDHG